MVTKEDIGKVVRIIESESVKELGKHFILREIGHYGIARLEWINDNLPVRLLTDYDKVDNLVLVEDNTVE